MSKWDGFPVRIFLSAEQEIIGALGTDVGHPAVTFTTWSDNRQRGSTSLFEEIDTRAPDVDLIRHENPFSSAARGVSHD
jgi:hypothetical protein